MNELRLRTVTGGVAVVTVPLGRMYQTMVVDRFGREIKTLQATYARQARENHEYCVSRYAHGNA